MLQKQIKYSFYIIALLFLITMHLKSFSQNKGIEKVFVHINQNVLVSGSELKYTAYVSNEYNKQVSSIIYFQLLDCDHIPVLNWKSGTNQQVVFGSKNIPESIPNGVYYLSAYTNKIRNYPLHGLNYTPVVIQRIYEDPIDTICFNNEAFQADSNSISTNTTFDEYLKVDVSENGKYSIVLKPQSKLKNAQLSVSVTEFSPTQSSNKSETFYSFSKKVNHIIENKKIDLLPMENDFSIISGKVLSANGSTPYAQKIVYLAYPDSSIHFKYFTTNINGEFCFLLDSSFSNKAIFLQTNSTDSLNWIIDDKKTFNKQIPKAGKSSTNLTQQEYITKLQKREVVHRVYHTLPTYNTTTSDFYQNNFFHIPKNIVKPSDYIELTNFQDICDNILPSVRFKVADNKVQIGMVIDQSIVFDNVLISVNGIPCFNTEYISKLTSKNIKQIEVFNSVIMHGDLTFNGAIAIYTYKKDIDEELLANSYYRFDNNFYSGVVQEKTDKETSLPIVTPNVYWNPNLKIVKNKPTTILFNKPEVGNKYVITINGLINNTIPFGYINTIELKK